MLIRDERIAESLAEVSPLRCLVRVARSTMRMEGRRCGSPYECCACAMPARRHDRPCELCGREAFRVLREEGTG